MRTQIAKTEYLPAEYYPPTFWLDTPSPFCAGLRWGLLSRKIFFIFSESIINSFWLYFDSDFIFFVSPIRFLLVIYFFRFSFGFSDIRFSVKLVFRISTFELVYIRSILSRLRFLTSLLIFDSFLLASISTCFSIIDSML